MKVNRDSWHYRFAMAFRQEAIEPNVCAYTRSLLLACVNVLLLLTIVLGLLCALGDMFGWLAAMIACRCWITPTIVAVIGMGFIGLIAGIFMLVVFSEAETFAPIREAAKARKEMFCPRIEFNG